MRLRTEAPDWFNEDNPELEAKCVSFPGTRAYDPWFGTEEDLTDEDSDEDDDVIYTILQEMEEAKKICKGTDDNRPCPLLSQCLEFAVVNNERFGVWGGMTPDERHSLRKKRRADWQAQQDGVQPESSVADWRIMQARESLPSS